MDSWISFWLAELTEPLSSPIYLALFVGFLVVSTLAIYAFRGIPHWIIESPQSRLLRVFSANIAIVSLSGASILVLQSMSVPLVNRRLWLGLALVILALQLIVLLALGRRITRRPGSDTGSDFTDVLH